jgi:hypothetical protein
LDYKAMTAQLLQNGKQTFLDANGDPLASGQVFFYEPATTTPKTTWQDAEKTTPNTNPVDLDAAGRAVIYGFGIYRQIVKDSDGNTIWDQETASVPVLGQILWAGTSGGTANLQDLTLVSQEFLVVSGDPVPGQAIAFVAGATNTDALDVNVLWDGSESSGPHDVLKGGVNGPVELTGGEVVQGNLYLIIYDDAAAAFHLLNLNESVVAVFSVHSPIDGQVMVAPLDTGPTYVLLSGAAGSHGYAETPATAQTDVSVRKNNTVIGTVRFAAGANAATFVGVSQTTFLGGDRLVLEFPDPKDATLAKLGVSLRMARSR